MRPPAAPRRACWVVALAAVVLVQQPAPSAACGLDIFGICGGADAIAKTLDSLPERVREAAQAILDHFFNDLLPSAVDKLTAAAKQLMDRAEKDYEKAIEDTREQLEELAKTVVKLVEELAEDITKDVEQIIQQVEDETTANVEKIISDVDDKVNALLTRLENDGQELFCTVSGYLDMLEKEFSSYFEKKDCECTQQMLTTNPGLAQDCKCTSCGHLGPIWPSCGCNPWGLKFGPGWYNKGKYDFLQCHLNKAIDWGNWTVDQIISQLSIIQEAALSFRCLEDMNPGSTANRQYFSDQYTNITHEVLVLQSAPHTSKLRSAALAARALPAPPAAQPAVAQLQV